MQRKTDTRTPPVLFTVDRMEEGKAVLVSDDGARILVPDTMLPPGAAEGSVLRLALSIDRAETRRRTESVRELQRRLLEMNG